jgi:hypothetical protein
VVAGNTEATYYLLKKRLERALSKVYDMHGFGLSDDFEDTIDEFFLYLYDRNLSIQDKRTFFSWTVATYRHFLINSAKKEMRKKALMEQVRLSPKGEECGLSNETMVLFLASAIAYADQRFTPRNRFVFYRMLLSFLDHSKAIPQAAMAQALDMTPVTYRVSTKRQKDRFLEYILMQESGATLDLDDDHGLMRDRIVDAFERLYELLMEYYNKSLEAIPNAQAIQSLRMDYSNDDGMMHEGMPMYGYVSNLDISILYPKIKHYLAVSG